MPIISSSHIREGDTPKGARRLRWQSGMPIWSIGSKFTGGSRRTPRWSSGVGV